MARIHLPLLLGLALAGFGADAQAALSPEERQELRQEIQAYLLEHPEILLDMTQKLRAMQAAEEERVVADVIAANEETIYRDPNSWVGGNPQGDVTIVEFMDYRCGYCRRAQPEVAALLAGDDNIRLVIKEFPILGEQSMLASQFAVAVLQLYGDAAYKAAHDALITLQGDITDKSLARLATALGYDDGAIAQEMSKDTVRDIIRDNHALAQALAISGTPTFIVEGRLVKGYVSQEELADIVKEHREKNGG